MAFSYVGDGWRNICGRTKPARGPPPRPSQAAPPPGPLLRRRYEHRPTKLRPWERKPVSFKPERSRHAWMMPPLDIMGRSVPPPAKLGAKAGETPDPASSDPGRRSGWSTRTPPPPSKESPPALKPGAISQGSRPPAPAEPRWTRRTSPTRSAYEMCTVHLPQQKASPQLSQRLLQPLSLAQGTRSTTASEKKLPGELGQKGQLHRTSFGGLDDWSLEASSRQLRRTVKLSISNSC